ncbi:hypothetical protein V5O48_009281 [Marasmius crinis-equi]|uniref:Uncharacterized protein n=1 Tax=Marasmius crinis-equi TaxID=585013 RepID=A0ABR3FBR9_9AGAR
MDCSIQDWNRYISKLYTRVFKDQHKNPKAVRERMAQFIKWADHRYSLYVNDMKRNKLKNLLQSNKLWGVHVFGYILSTKYNGTVAGPGFAWGANPQYLLVKEKCQAQITRTLQDFTTHFRHMQMTEMENKIMDVELAVELERKPGKTVKVHDRRLLGKFVVTNAVCLLSEKNRVNIQSFVCKALLKEIHICTGQSAYLLLGQMVLC